MALNGTGQGNLNISSEYKSITLKANNNINLLGGIVGGYDTLTVNSSPNLYTLTTLLNTTNGNFVVNLANGVVGQIKHFALYTDGGNTDNSANIIFNTINNTVNTITLNGPGNTLSLLYTPNKWVIIGGVYN